MILRLSAQHRALLEHEARATFPNECCGLIEGAREEMRVTALYPARNVSSQPDESFEIDPATQFTLMRALRGSDRAIIGCYHSHPRGAPEPSVRDAANANEEGFVWLIAGERASGFNIAAYIWCNGAFAPIPIESDA